MSLSETLILCLEDSAAVLSGQSLVMKVAWGNKDGLDLVQSFLLPHDSLLWTLLSLISFFPLWLLSSIRENRHVSNSRVTCVYTMFASVPLVCPVGCKDLDERDWKASVQRKWGDEISPRISHKRSLFSNLSQSTQRIRNSDRQFTMRLFSFPFDCTALLYISLSFSSLCEGKTKWNNVVVIEEIA